LQLPCSLSAVVTAKALVLLAFWLIATLPCLTAVALWSLSGGHVGWAELANLFLGHLLFAAVVVSISFLAAAVAESSATAAILALAATLGFWVLDFAATGESGLLKSLSNLSLTTLLRGFEQGVFSSIATFGALIASALLLIIGSILLDLRVTLARKLLTSSLAAVLAAGLAAGVTIRPLNVDTTEDDRNSFAPADTATLAGLDKALHVLVRLAPEDPPLHRL
jgi:ABC-2 family transporter